jgi:hypothetical protein
MSTEERKNDRNYNQSDRPERRRNNGNRNQRNDYKRRRPLDLSQVKNINVEDIMNGKNLTEPACR